MNEDEILARRVLDADPKAAKKAAKIIKKTGGARSARGNESADFGRSAGVSQPQMMHVPPQPPSDGQDADIYNMVKGETGFGEKKTYYAPVSRVILKIVCIILVPLAAIYAFASFAGSNYHPTFGDFEIEIYRAGAKADAQKYILNSRDTKRLEIREVTIKTGGNDKITETKWQGYYLKDLMAVLNFEENEGAYDYFRFVAADGGELGAGGPSIDGYMVLVFKIEKNQRKDVYGKTVSKNVQPTVYMITNPKFMTDNEWYFGSKEQPVSIEFDIKVAA
ncbi:MAG: hypothetical protein LBP79_04005 [Clostridiales bacterium]|jgi:hypothetical protein|nr:hypothetical protein [Clostridiales bacterium]